MATIENGGMRNRIGILGCQFRTEKHSEPGYVEVWKGDDKIRGFVFYVGKFSVPILRSRPYQRVHNQVERNVLRPWLMGRVTYKKKILLENPGRPGIILRGILNHYNIVGIGHDGNKDLLSTAVWINGERMDFRELSQDKGPAYGKRKIVVTTTPILEQTFQINSLGITMEIILSSDGPVQRVTVENLKESSLELNYSFMSLFPKKVTKYCGHDNSNKLFWGNVKHPSRDRNTADVTIPQAQWLAVYNPISQFGTVIYSPDFKKGKMNHLLVVDRRQDFKVYHIVGDYEYFTRVQDRSKLAGLTVNFGHPQQPALFVRLIEAVPKQWKIKAEKKASQLVKRFSL